MGILILINYSIAVPQTSDPIVSTNGPNIFSTGDKTALNIAGKYSLPVNQNSKFPSIGKIDVPVANSWTAPATNKFVTFFMTLGYLQKTDKTGGISTKIGYQVGSANAKTTLFTFEYVPVAGGTNSFLKTEKKSLAGFPQYLSTDSLVVLSAAGTMMISTPSADNFITFDLANDAPVFLISFEINSSLCHPFVNVCDATATSVTCNLGDNSPNDGDGFCKVATTTSPMTTEFTLQTFPRLFGSDYFMIKANNIPISSLTYTAKALMPSESLTGGGTAETQAFWFDYQCGKLQEIAYYYFSLKIADVKSNFELTSGFGTTYFVDFVSKCVCNEGYFFYTDDPAPNGVKPKFSTGSPVASNFYCTRANDVIPECTSSLDLKAKEVLTAIALPENQLSITTSFSIDSFGQKIVTIQPSFPDGGEGRLDSANTNLSLQIALLDKNHGANPKPAFVQKFIITSGQKIGDVNLPLVIELNNLIDYCQSTNVASVIAFYTCTLSISYFNPCQNEVYAYQPLVINVYSDSYSGAVYKVTTNDSKTIVLPCVTTGACVVNTKYNTNIAFYQDADFNNAKTDSLYNVGDSMHIHSTLSMAATSGEATVAVADQPILTHAFCQFTLFNALNTKMTSADCVPATSTSAKVIPSGRGSLYEDIPIILPTTFLDAINGVAVGGYISFSIAHQLNPPAVRILENENQDFAMIERALSNSNPIQVTPPYSVNIIINTDSVSQGLSSLGIALIIIAILLAISVPLAIFLIWRFKKSKSLSNQISISSKENTNTYKKNESPHEIDSNSIKVEAF